MQNKNPFAKRYAQASDAELGLSPRKPPQSAPEDGAKANAERIPVNGFKQVLEMLQIADPAFRESLLKRLGARDPELARSLRRELGL